MGQRPILVLNSGSSSLKFGFYIGADSGVQLLGGGTVDGIGKGGGKLTITDAGGKTVEQRDHVASRSGEAFQAVAGAWTSLGLDTPMAVGHRVVHGGPKLQEHQQVTPAVLEQLQAAVEFAPLHLPSELRLIREAQRQFPDAPQFACFDTAFHRTLPESAARFPLPTEYWNQGIRKYGFHGISCESILHQCHGKVPRRMIIAHLGNGASVTAVVDGKSVDTTMGLTPTGGIIMGTRPGDLDPGLLVHLLRIQGMKADQLEDLLDKKSGLLGISGISSDMRALHESGGSADAALAIEMFCRGITKAIGAFSAIMGGLERLVFTGGIGEHDAAARWQICSQLRFIGIGLDEDANRRGGPVVGECANLVEVLVLQSDEEGQMARHVLRLLGQK
jgi:acetate kinase